MSMEIKVVLSQQKELKEYADNLLETYRQLTQYQEKLNSAWQGTEMKVLNDTIDSLRQELRVISMEMEDIGHDIIRAYQELGEINEI